MPGDQNNLAEVQRYLDNATRALTCIENAETADELRNAWEDFLGHFGRCIGRQISYGLNNPRSKAWANRLKNASTKDDPGLVFLREARNAIEHGLTPFAEFGEPAVHIGGNFVRLEGGSSISMIDCTFNGIPTGNFHVTTSGGRVESVSGEPNVPIQEVPRSIRLVAIENAEKGITVGIPTVLSGDAFQSRRPDDLARLGVKFLRSSLSELEVLWQ